MSALALFYMAVMPLLAKRYSEKGRYYAWLIIVVGLIFPFRPQFDNAIVKVDVAGETAAPIIQIGNGTPVAIPDVNAALSPAISWWQVAAVVWLVGAVAFLAYHVVKHYRFVKMAGRWSEVVTNEQILTLLQRLKTEMGISKQISLYVCPCIGSPMMIGFVNPRILLPKSDLAKDELLFILKHELVHYKRKDLWYKCLVLIATAIHWFNPIVYLMAKAIDILCEMSCDAEIVRSTDADTRQHYSETIIGVVKYQSKMKTALSTNFYGGKKGMKKRIVSIMDMGKKKTGLVIVGCALIVTMGTGLAFAVNAAANTPQLNEISPTEELFIARSVYAGNEQFTQEEYDLVMSQKFDGYEEMTVADFNSKILEISNDNEDTYLNAMEHVMGGLDENDENAVFLLNTLTVSGEENACKHWQSFDVYRDPTFYGEASKKVGEALIDGKLFYEWEISVNYSISYKIPDENNLTITSI